MTAIHARLGIDDFLDRIRSMPDIEAKEQVQLRQDTLSLQYGMLLTEKSRHGISADESLALGREMVVITCDRGRLKRALVEINRRMDATTWSGAVRAIFGQEGYERCKVWMIMNDPERASGYEGDLQAFAEKHGLVLQQP